VPPETDVTDTEEGNSEFKFSADRAEPDSGETEENEACAGEIMTSADAQSESPRAARRREPVLATPRVDILMSTTSAFADES